MGKTGMTYNRRDFLKFTAAAVASAVTLRNHTHLPLTVGANTA